MSDREKENKIGERLSKAQIIKQIITKTDTNKIVEYLKEYPNSKTLKRIINYQQRV